MKQKKAREAQRKANLGRAKRGGFDRSKLSGAFMNNAKASNDNVAGWGMDFSNPTQQAKIEDMENIKAATNMKKELPTPKELDDAQMKKAIE